MDKQRIIFNMPDGKEIVVKGLSKEEVDAVLAQNGISTESDNSVDEKYPQDKLKTVDQNEVKRVLTNAKNSFKTMANSLTAAYKSKAVESIYSVEGKTVTKQQKIILLLIFLFTSATILPWVIGWWVFVMLNKKDLEAAEELIEIEIPSTMMNYKNTTDIDLKSHLRRLFLRQFKKANDILDKLSGVSNLKESILTIKMSPHYKKALEFKNQTENELQ
jgi:hypothetical protein